MPQTTKTRPERGQELELTIDDLAFGGNGVARADGYVLFVQGAVPGDRVRAVVTKRKRDYGEARTLEVLQPSPDRIPPVADHPGAPWQVLPYARQLEVKAAQVAEALRRIGHLEGFVQEAIVPAVDQWGYRNKLEYSFGMDGERLVCGFHAPGSWEDIVDGESRLGSERANQARREVLAFCREEGLRRTTAGPSAASCATSSSARPVAPARCRSASSPRPAIWTRMPSAPPSRPTR